MPYCGICDLGFVSEAALEGHRTDKKHLSRSEEYQRRLLEAALSVHVTGFSRSISKDVLQGYFNRFGKVVDITYIDHCNSWWPFAFVKFESLAVASQVLRYKHHCLYGHFLRVQPKRLKFRNPSRLEVQPHDSVSNDGQTHNGCPQRIGQLGYQMTRKKYKDVKFQDQLDLKETFLNLQENLLEKDTIEKQMTFLYDQLRLTDDDLQKRTEFCKLLLSILDPYFPGCSVILFGSSVNGFGVRGCDVDVFLDLDQLMPKELPTSDSTNAKVKLPKDTKPVRMEEFAVLSPYQKVKFLLKILGRNLREDYNNFFPVPSVRCPIVRFNHRLSKITCDFSIENKLGLNNSFLLRYLSECDWRVQPLVFIIRLWAKSKEVASIGGPRFSSYSITLMVLFFLQNTKPAVLPSVKRIIDICTEEENTVIDGCNCSYPQRPPQEILTPTENTDSLADLLQKFFDFFLHFDYETIVISPRTGSFLSRSDFDDQPDLKSFKMSPVCVQDPYLLEHNTAGNVSDKVKTEFIKELSVARHKLSQSKSGNNLWGVAHILATDESSDETTKGRSSKTKQFNVPYSISLPINVGRLSRTMETFAKKFDCAKLVWCKVFCFFLQIVLKDGLLIEYSENSKQRVSGSLSDEKETVTGLTDTKSNSDFPSVIVNKSEEVMTDITSISSEQDNDNTLMEPGLILKKRQSDEFICGEVKRIKLKEDSTEVVNKMPDSTQSDEIQCTDSDENSPENLKNCHISSDDASLEKSVLETEEGEEEKEEENHNDQNIGSSDSNLLPGDEQNLGRNSIDDDVPLECKDGIVSDEENVEQLPKEDKDTDNELEEETDSEVLMDLTCTVKHHTWCNRKNVRQKILAQWNGDDFELEKRISEQIVIANKTSNDSKPLTTFQVKVVPEMEHLALTSVSVGITPLYLSSKEASVFYQFLASFITRMVSTHFIKWCNSNCTEKFNFSNILLNKVSPENPCEADTSINSVSSR